VRFLDTPSLEGMLVRDPGLHVLLPSTKHRPRVRILFSCAHEIGHHQFGHGTKADHYLDEQQDRGAFAEEEFLADSFAGHLLMTRTAVLDAFARRGWTAETPTTVQAYVVAGELGVGFDTLLTHMNIVMGLLTNDGRNQLAKASPKSVKAELTGTACPEPLTVVDADWRHVPIDSECGELVMLPVGAGNSCPLLSYRFDHAGMSVYVASSVGLTSLNWGRDNLVLRVSRRHYVGPFSNRYLPDPDEH
jgi:hypothetical protein